jgi:hypothetical protein
MNGKIEVIISEIIPKVFRKSQYNFGGSFRKC